MVKCIRSRLSIGENVVANILGNKMCMCVDSCHRHVIVIAIEIYCWLMGGDLLLRWAHGQHLGEQTQVSSTDISEGGD